MLIDKGYENEEVDARYILQNEINNNSITWVLSLQQMVKAKSKLIEGLDKLGVHLEL